MYPAVPEAPLPGPFFLQLPFQPFFAHGETAELIAGQETWETLKALITR